MWLILCSLAASPTIQGVEHTKFLEFCTPLNWGVMQALGQTAFVGSAVPLCKPKCIVRSRGMVAVRAVAAPAKLDTRKSEQVRASKLYA